MAKAPMKYEGSKKDMKMDAMMAKKTGMSKKAWESSPQDKSMDKAGQAAMMMRKGGGKMSEKKAMMMRKDGGKMSTGAAKKGMGAEKRASGGKVGSRGATQRGFGAEKH
jgi:hypothetical protein